MVHSRCVSSLLAISLVFGCLACSQGTSPEIVQPVADENGNAADDESGQDNRNLQWWRNEAVLTELQLTDGQLQAIRELMSTASQEGAQLRQQERRLTVSYLRALAQEPYDPELVGRVSGRLVEVLSVINQDRIENLHNVRDILSQEQWTKLWDIAPRALQIGRFRIIRGPMITVEPDPDASPTLDP